MTTNNQTPVLQMEPETLPQQMILLDEVSSGNVASVPGAMEIQSSNAIVPVKPKHVSPARDQELKQQAEALVSAILEDPSNVTITSQLYALGSEAVASNSENITLVDQKIGPVMKEIGTDSMLGKNLSQIKATLDLVNPHVVGTTAIEFTTAVTKPKLWGLLGSRIVNEVVSRLPVGGTEVMTIINGRRDSIRETINTLKGHLWMERDKALHNALELSQVANHLADAQEGLQEAAYQGQLIWAGLNMGRVHETDLVRQQSLSYLIGDLATVVVDLQAIDQLNIQSRMGAETLYNNCRGIQVLVSRVTNTLLPSVMTALAVKAAATQQAQLVAAARGIGQAASDTIAQTAKDIGRVSVDIAKMNTESLVDLDKLEEASAAYEAMQAELNAVFATAERNARGISNRLSILNDKMRDRTDPLTAARRAKEQAGV